MERVGAILNLFAGAATVVCLSLYGIITYRPWTAVALVAASAVWTLTWVGSLVGSIGTFEDFEGIGYWIMLASVGMGFIGTVVVFVSSRGSRNPISPEEPVPTGTA